MPSKVATAYLEMRANGAPMMRDIDRVLNNDAKKSVEAGGTKLGTLFSQSFVAKLKNVTHGITAALGAGLAASLGYGVKLAAEAEQIQTSFEVMTGSAATATKLISDLKKMGAATPFEFTDLSKATQTLLTFGRASDVVLSDLDMLSNVASGDANKLNSLALVFGQIAANGRLTGGDLLQLVNTGFNPLNQIAKRTGESMTELRDRMSKGNIGFDEVRHAFQDATSAGGQFYGMNEKQSKTILGLWSTFKDNFAAALQGFAEPMVRPLGEMLNYAIKVMEGLQPVIAMFAKWTAENKELVLTLAGIAAGGAALVAALAPVATIVIGLTSAFTALAPIVAVAAANLALLSGAAAVVGLVAVIREVLLWATAQRELNAEMQRGIELREKLAESDASRVQKTISESRAIADPEQRAKFLDDAIKAEQINLETYQKQVAAGQKQIDALKANSRLPGQSPERMTLNDRKISQLEAGELGDARRKLGTTQDAIAALQAAKAAPVVASPAGGVPAAPVAGATSAAPGQRRSTNPLTQFIQGVDRSTRDLPLSEFQRKMKAVAALPNSLREIAAGMLTGAREEQKYKPPGTGLVRRDSDLREITTIPDVAPKFVGVTELNRQIQSSLSGKDDRQENRYLKESAGTLSRIETYVKKTSEQKPKGVFSEA